MQYTQSASTLLEWATVYLDYVKNRHVSKTYAEKHIAFRQLFQTFSPHMHSADLHRGHVLKHFEEQARTRSGNAANKDRKNLLAAWNWAAHYLPDFPQQANPFDVLRCAEERSPRYVPPEQDFWKVYHVAESDQDKLMLLCYLHLAARRTEIFQLRREDVDLDRRQVRLFTRKRKDGSMHYDWLPMSDTLRNAFVPHMAKGCGKWVFPNPQSGLPYFDRNKWMVRLCLNAGVEKFGLHAIRHLSASILVAEQVPLPEVQAVLRHTNLTTTQRYVHRIQTGRCLTSVFDLHKRG
jgi:integrase